MLALVDYVVDAWMKELGTRLQRASPWDAPVSNRVRAYVDWCISGECDPTNLVMLADPRSRETLTARWQSASSLGTRPNRAPPGSRPSTHAGAHARRGRLVHDRSGHLSAGSWSARTPQLHRPCFPRRGQRLTG